jgi:hypothetical protein
MYRLLHYLRRERTLSHNELIKIINVYRGRPLAELAQFIVIHFALDAGNQHAKKTPAGQKPDRNAGKETEHRPASGSKAAQNG